ncbi:hypothetical protein Z959_10115 [Clostridium novyi B str. ATCC 27606]|uniref:Uncharacterized protein n=1 Tax=Clostridium novyi B str. ATCC 27606 TaxID=1443123 RepID=A0AA40M2K6_CLONO|nr:hypothetical protein [Clostridium novyi]KEI16234.1 hypothetical protein Z959_10115 [Clostridium novyi B str. ATCC 27606]
MDQIQFEIITADKKKEMKLTKKQIVVLLEALWDFKQSVHALEPKSDLRKRILENKEEEINKLFKNLQESINYDFEKHLEKCNKKSKDDDPGMETMNWLANGGKDGQ